jgi:phage shock protein PspC (stress-responsive transcriptional regulator)
MRKALYRSRTDRWIAGVCGGLGDYFGVDANALRLAFVVLALWQGVGVVVYLLMVIIVPDEPVRELAVEEGLPVPPEDETQRRGRILGAILVIGGAYLLVRSTDLFNTLLAERGLGVLLIAGGLAVLLLRSRRRD